MRAGRTRGASTLQVVLYSASSALEVAWLHVLVVVISKGARHASVTRAERVSASVDKAETVSTSKSEQETRSVFRFQY